MKLKDISHRRNFVAKSLRGLSGAGVHELKHGKKRVKRAKQKRDVQKLITDVNF